MLNQTNINYFEFRWSRWIFKTCPKKCFWER